MEFFFRSSGRLLAWLPEARRHTHFCLMQSARRCRCRCRGRGRGYLARSACVLSSTCFGCATRVRCSPPTHTRFTTYRAYMNADELRSVCAFLADCNELGLFEAQGVRRVMPPNLIFYVGKSLGQRDNKRARNVAGGTQSKHMCTPKWPRRKHPAGLPPISPSRRAFSPASLRLKHGQVRRGLRLPVLQCQQQRMRQRIKWLPIPLAPSQFVRGGFV